MPRIKTNVEYANENGKLQVYKDKAGKLRWRVRAENNKIVADSGQGYKNLRNLAAGLQSALAVANSTASDFIALLLATADKIDAAAAK